MDPWGSAATHPPVVPGHFGTRSCLLVLSQEAGLGWGTEQSPSAQPSSPQAWVLGTCGLTALSFQTMTADDVVCTRVYVRE